MPPKTQALLEALEAELGIGAVLTGEAVSERAQGIWRPAPLEALAIVRPKDTREVSFVLKACFEAGQSVIPQGGLTGLVHGADTGPEDLILSLERMNAIEEIDQAGRTVRVQAGVPLQTLQETVAEQGLSFPLDLGARGSCFLGGNLSTNAGGNRVLRYGMARENTLGVEAVLADGTVIDSLYGMVKNNAGFDLKQLFIGSEGTLGIITRAVLRLREAPGSRLSMLLALPDFPSVTELLRHLDRGLGGQLSAFEVMWPEFYHAVATAPRCPAPPLPLGSPFTCSRKCWARTLPEMRPGWSRCSPKLWRPAWSAMRCWPAPGLVMRPCGLYVIAWICLRRVSLRRSLMSPFPLAPWARTLRR